MPVDLHRAIAIYTELRERLITDFQLNEDEPVLLDTLNGEADLEDALVLLVREAQRAEADAKAMDAIIEANSQRKARHKARVERLRARVAWAMDSAGIKSVKSPDLTISLRSAKPKLAIDDEATLPPECFKEVVTRKLDRDAVLARLNADLPTPGARMTNGETGITVRAS